MKILNLGWGEKLGQVWMINRLSMITWQILIRRGRLQPPALPSYSYALALTDFEYLDVKKADCDSIQSEPPDYQSLHFLKRLIFLLCVGIRERRVISALLKDGYAEMFGTRYDFNDKKLKDQFTQITKVSSLPLTLLYLPQYNDYPQTSIWTPWRLSSKLPPLEICLFTFFLRVRWDDRHHPRVCTEAGQKLQ